MNDKKTEVEQLITKAVKAEKSEDALRFSQAACNAANALICVVNREKLVASYSHR
jgi:hypothetical protein